MTPLVLIPVLAALATAAPEGYNLQSSGPDLPHGGCRNGEVVHVDGTCVLPEVSRNLFVFAAPDQPQPSGPPPQVPPPRVEHNILFIRAPEQGEGLDPIVVPPPKQRNIVYVLSKQSQQGQQVIEVPAPPPSNPEVYFVNVGEGENPTLPGGLDLQSALSSAVSADSQFIGGSGQHSGEESGIFSNLGGGGGFGGNTGIGGGVGGHLGGAGEPDSSIETGGFVDTGYGGHTVRHGLNGNTGGQAGGYGFNTGGSSSSDPGRNIGREAGFVNNIGGGGRSGSIFGDSGSHVITNGGAGSYRSNAGGRAGDSGGNAHGDRSFGGNTGGRGYFGTTGANISGGGDFAGGAGVVASPGGDYGPPSNAINTPSGPYPTT